MIPYILAVVGGYLIGDSLKGKQYARGGFVGKGERVWNKMRNSERMSFLYENFTPEITPRGQELLVGRTFNFLPKNVKMKLESKYADVEYADGGEIASFEKKIKDAMKEENKWHFINEVVDGKNVQLKMFVGKKEVDVQIFRINGLGAKMPRNYAGKRETLKMIMDNFQTKMEDGGGIQQAPNVSKIETPLTEKQFYKKYVAQHKDLRGKRNDTWKENKVEILKSGFKEGVNVNALPIYTGTEINVIDQQYGNRKGDIIYILPKEGVTLGRNGYKTKEGYIPKLNEIVIIEYDKQPTYEAYKNQAEGGYMAGGGVGEPYDTMTKYQIEKEYKRLNEKRDLLKKKYGTFESDEVVENEKEIDKIITLLYGKDFSGVGQKFKDGGGIQQAPNQEYLKWFKDWYKNKYNDIFILISLPNEISSPITEAGQTNIILDVIQKYEEGIDAKKYLEQLVNKADELGVTLHLVPNPRTEKLKSEAHKKKITKDYLISYYEKFGFKKVADDHMVREPKDISRMAKGGKIETYAVYPQRKVNIAKPAGEELYTTDYISTFRVVGTLDDAEAQAQKFVRENEAMYPFVVVKKIHPSGNPLKNKDISRVEKDKITKL